MVLKYDGSASRMYLRLNNTAYSDVAQSGNLRQNSNNIKIGNHATGGDNPFDGIIDEVRISSIARSNAWLNTEYNNQSDPATFFTLGSETPATVIDLITFSATGDGNHVRVDWQTAQEINNLGFYLYRATSSSGPYVQLNEGIIAGLNFSVKGKSYSYVDTSVTPGTLYYYKLQDLDASGKRTFHGPVCVDWDADGMPERLRIVDYIHGHTREVGKPEVPLKGILLDIPEGQSAALSVLQTEEDDIYSGYQIFPVPEQVVDDQGSVAGVGESFVWNQRAYGLDAFYPAEVAQLGDVFVFRGQSKQQLLFYPLAFNPATGQLKHFRKIRVRIDYVDGNLAKADPVTPAPWRLPVTSGASDSIASIGQMAMAFGAAPMIANPLSPVLSSLGVLVNALWAPDISVQGAATRSMSNKKASTG